MKHLQKIICLILFTTLLVTGCGNQTTGENSTDSQTESQVESETASETESIKESEVPSETSTEVEPEIGTTENETSSEAETEVATESQTPSEPETPSESEQPTDSETPSEPEEPAAPQYTYSELDKTMYAKTSVNVRDLPSKNGSKLGSLKEAQEVHVTGQCNETSWYRIDFNGKVGYVSDSYLVSEKPKEETTQKPSTSKGPNITYEVYSNYTPATEAELNGMVFETLNEQKYTSDSHVLWRVPFTEFLWDNPYKCGTISPYHPIKVTGYCAETDWYRVELDGKTLYIQGSKSTVFGQNPFIDTIPTVSKSDPGYKAGTAEWHAYWDGTTIGEYWLITSSRLHLVVEVYKEAFQEEVLYYSGGYPMDYVIGSYADVTANGATVKGEY